MEKLSEFIKSKVDIPSADLRIVLEGFQKHTVRKNRHLVRKGQFVNAYYFIETGALRIYFDKQDKEITGWVALEKDFFTELHSFRSGKPTEFNIQAIEDTVLMTISKDRMEDLYRRFPAWQQFGREIWEDAFLKVTKAIIGYQTTSAEERYLQMTTSSDLLQKLPLKDLASYLGITQTSLSRLRKKIK